jgi:hypothetical protein
MIWNHECGLSSYNKRLSRQIKAEKVWRPTWSIRSALVIAHPFLRYASRTSSHELQQSSSDCTNPLTKLPQPPHTNKSWNQASYTYICTYYAKHKLGEWNCTTCFISLLLNEFKSMNGVIPSSLLKPPDFKVSQVQVQWTHRFCAKTGTTVGFIVFQPTTMLLQRFLYLHPRICNNLRSELWILHSCYIACEHCTNLMPSKTLNHYPMFLHRKKMMI